MSKIFTKKYNISNLQIDNNVYLNIITCTFNRPGRINYLSHLKSLLDKQKNIRWFVIDDNDTSSQELADFLPNYAIHLFCGPTRDKGHAQRNMAMEYILDHNLDGIIYNADDDNKFDPLIFDEIRKTINIGILPVGNLSSPEGGSERPIIIDGKFKRWNSFWQRRFPVDMAGFCFNAKLLKKLKKPIWKHKGVGGESEFLTKIAKSERELQFLCDDCTKTYVWHNELLAQPYIEAIQTIELTSKEIGPRFGKTSGTIDQYKEIKEKIFHSLSQNDIEDIENIYQNIDGVFDSPDRSESCAIANIVSTIDSGNIIEIGCWHGRTTALLSKFKHTNSKLFVVDHFESQDGLTYNKTTKNDNIKIFKNNMTKYSIDQNNFTLIESDSTTINWRKYVDKNSIKCIFYDGDPSLKSIRKTILNMLPYLNKEQSYIIFHDAAWRDHQSFINTLCSKYEFQLHTYINIWEGLVILDRGTK